MMRARWKSWFHLKLEAPGAKPRKRRAAFVVPLLEALEDRSLPSVTPVVTFGPDTVYQVVAVDNAGTTNDTNAMIASPQAFVNAINFSFTIDQNGTSSGQLTLAGNVTVHFLLSSSATGTANFALPESVQTFDTLQDVNVFSPNYSVSVSLFPTRGAHADPAASYNVTIATSQSANGATLGITVAAVGASGKPTADYNGIFDASNRDGINGPASESSGPTSANDWFSPNTSIGISTISILFPGTSFLQKTATDAAGAIFLLRASGVAGSTSYLTAFDFGFGSSNGQPKEIRTPIPYSNTLVLADSPGYHLTLSIIQEVSNRANSSGAQVTWTGQRHPTEAPWLGPPLEKTGLKLSSAQDQLKTTSDGDADQQSPLSAEVEVRPTEKMVAEILRSLEQARADERAKDISQGANRAPADLHAESEQTESWALAYWPWDPGAGRADPTLLGDPLNHFLDGVAAKEPYPRSDSAEPPGPEQNEPGENSLSPNSRRIVFHRGWIHLAEGVAGLLWVLCWPGAIWPGLAQPQQKTEEEPAGRR